MNRVFGSPYKFNLYSHYTHFPQQYSISLSMSCTLCVLTQILHELKWRLANTILQNGTFGETAVRSQPPQSFTIFISPDNSLFTNHTHRNSDTVAPDSTASITMSPLAKIFCCIPSQQTGPVKAAGRWGRAQCSSEPQHDSMIAFCSLQIRLWPPTAQGSKHGKKWEQGGESLEPLSSATPTALCPGIYEQDIPERCFCFKRCDLKQTVQSN